MNKNLICSVYKKQGLEIFNVRKSGGWTLKQTKYRKAKLLITSLKRYRQELEESSTSSTYHEVSLYRFLWGHNPETVRPPPWSLRVTVAQQPHQQSCWYRPGSYQLLYDSSRGRKWGIWGITYVSWKHRGHWEGRKMWHFAKISNYLLVRTILREFLHFGWWSSKTFEYFLCCF